ncbi:MAG: hypothetical protein ACFNP4_07985, partial [Capnocytophaga gingivalis]|uniref:hypothetical protein n=1 Tax=Capnocytophaga gingivalis TaxID=1017 RepID=UPI00360C12B5
GDLFSSNLNLNTLIFLLRHITICSPERFSIYFFYYITIFFVILEGMFMLIKLFSRESYLNLFSFKDNGIIFFNSLGYFR